MMRSWFGELTYALMVLVVLTGNLFAEESVLPGGEPAGRLEALEEEVLQLRMAIEQMQQHAPPVVQEPVVLPPKDPDPPKKESKKPEATVYPTIKVTGFFQADAAWFSQDIANRNTVGDIQDGADFRRARLAAGGKVAENVGYMVEFDFGFPGRPSFMDVWLEVEDFSVLNDFKVGYFRVPIGLDGLTSARELTFIERGLPFAFLPFRQIGVMSSGSNEEEGTTWALNLFRFPTDVFGGQAGDDGGYGFAARRTGLLVDYGDCGVVHVGGAYCLVDPSNNMVQYRNQPEIFVAELGGAALAPPLGAIAVPAFVDTGAIAADQSHLLAGELAATWGPFHAQSELIYVIVNRTAADQVAFYGVSAQAAYILTGEHRPYNRKNGVLGRVVPKHPYDRNGCGIGAWELASRWSLLDLNDKNVQGGQLNNLTFGVNWYLNKFTKFQLNYIHAFLDAPVIGPSDADIVALRAQLDF
ncbi:MAG: porin [Planctomycetaceae bacterium]|nr:porin [Planctomycetaceae bacterium]